MPPCPPNDVPGQGLTGQGPPRPRELNFFIKYFAILLGYMVAPLTFKEAFGILLQSSPVYYGLIKARY